MKNVRYDSQLVAGDLNVGPPKYEVLFTQPMFTLYCVEHGYVIEV
jgi:hypothetical protein